VKKHVATLVEVLLNVFLKNKPFELSSKRQKVVIEVSVLW